ncbi:histidine kinase N-terminal 7TM domain-containing diguanylate cyclase [Paenibacillus rigui]|uniref:GGDEF domain-containing protein n=1 Tax=Paenibacillus rigui TaxID=554312 RepID=A0A229UHP6_9BACL|nr:diguanylate cyclase [Paenibacillus rigui]OXM82900.1 GGDEF domain-containing protein [Paenibacillus rigui]
MGISTWLDLVLLFLLFVLFAYVFVTVTITNLHKAYFAFHFLMMLWPLCQFAIQTAANPSLQLFYLNIAFVGCSLIGIGWLVFTLFLIGRSDMLRSKIMTILCVPALLAALGVVVNPYGIFVQPIHGGYIQRAYGPLFWFIITILLAYLFISVYLMLQTIASARSPRIQSQVRLVVKGIMVLIVCALSDILLNVVLAPWLPVIPGLTSGGILLSDIIFIIAICRDKVLDLITIAHQKVIDTIGRGILVLDENETIVEINQSMRAYVDLQLGDRFEIATFLSRSRSESDKESFLQFYRRRMLESVEIEITLDTSDRCHGILHAAPIMVNSIWIGRTIMFQDVSELRQLVEEKKRQNIILQERNQELLMIQEELYQTNRKLEQQVITDSLTGCYNRHYLTRQLEHEVVEHVRSNTPFSIILLDIDYFKQVNDRYGHLAGDEVICSTVETIRRNLRKTDILARYGGEEFIIYLPGTNRSQAAMLAEQVKAAVESSKVSIPNEAQLLSITISLGLLTIDTFADKVLENARGYLTELFKKVDEALYQAKEEGRNRIVSRAPD